MPPRESSPNWRGAWPAKARAVREFREMAGWATLWAVQDDMVSFAWVYQARDIVLDVEIAWAKPRRMMDDDNAWASLKAARDGIADVLEIDDRVFRIGRMTQGRGAGMVTVVLREAG